ncbi:hypothetical protein IE53DRAFT_372088 [Violaceomyces palustris]|uniref:Uncharacterized protein n=1 Tax=Violaceomyces palustris TaxID=1673888 RepID=A0ACD0NLS0_9BASI|nr:hypothetical protein IE53DRAFT_372088 [Violaceomyces palustris]
MIKGQGSRSKLPNGTRLRNGHRPPHPSDSQNPGGDQSSKVLAPCAPRVPPSDRPLKILVFETNHKVIAFLIHLLSGVGIKCRNLAGSNVKANKRSLEVEQWGITLDVPVAFVSESMATGLNIMQASILIMAHMSFNGLMDD